MKYILAVLLVLFASYGDIFLFRIGIVPVAPSLFLIPLFISLSILRYSFNDYIDIIKTHTFKFFAFITFLSIVYTAFSDASTEIMIGEIALNFITLFIYVFAVHFFRKEGKPMAMAVLVGGLVVSGGSVLYDFFIGLPKHSVRLEQSVRKGGFGENPNQAASGIKFLALAALVYITETKVFRFMIIAFLLLTVFLTFSRSGLVSVFFILVLGAINNWSNKFQKNGKVLFQSFFKLVLLFSVIYISLIAFSNVIRDNFPQFTRGAAGKRLDLLTGQSESSKISSDALEGGRADLLLAYFEEFKQNPMGFGTGYSIDKRINGDKLNTHNYYVYLAVNLGFIALLVYLFYVAYNANVAIKHDQFYYFIFAILFFLEGFFTHTIFHERPIVICLAFFDSLLYPNSTSSQYLARRISKTNLP